MKNNPFREVYVEALKGKQKKLDVDKDGKIEKSDLEKLRSEEVGLEEATPYYNKPSFLKKMGRVAKQERLAREKKEAEAKKPVKENAESTKCPVCNESPCACDDSHGFVEGLKPEHNMRPGWMLKADPELAAKVKKNKEIAKARKASYGNPAAGKSVKEETISEGAYEKAEENKRSADAAKSQARPFDYHMHMADHHDNMSQWHASKGRHGEADKHAQKSDEHHEKAMKLKEGYVPDHSGVLNKKDTATMGKLAALMAKEKAAKAAKKPVKEESELDEAKKANTASTRAELNKRPRKELTGADADKKKKESDDAWERLMAHAAANKKTNEEVSVQEETKKPDPANKSDSPGFQAYLAKRRAEREKLKKTAAPVKEEAEQLDEISSETEHSYFKKAYAQKNDKTVPKETRKKRSAGMNKVINRTLRRNTLSTPGAGEDFKDQEKKRGVGHVRDHVEYAGNLVIESRPNDHEETEMQEGYVVRYNNKKSEKHGSEKHFDSLEAANKHAERGNSVDKIGGKYTVHKTNEKGHDMREETEQLDELSKKTLGNYVTAARQDNKDHVDSRHSGDEEESKWAKDRMVKRNKGIKRADNKLNKEEATMQFTQEELQLIEQFIEIAEKMNMSKASMGDVIRDFKKSDAPQFKDKSVEKRRQMAIAAKLQADRETKKEETEVSGFASFMLEYESDKGGRYVHKGKYGSSYDAGEDDDDKPASTEKRGRGRPKGSSSGARQKGSTTGKKRSGVEMTGYPLHLPNR